MATMTFGAQARRYANRINWYLVVAALLITSFGIVIIQSAGLHTDPGEYRKQILYAILGIGVMIGFARIDYRDPTAWPHGRAQVPQQTKGLLHLVIHMDEQSEIDRPRRQARVVRVAAQDGDCVCETFARHPLG